MKTLLIALTASLAIAGGTARAQETKGHEHHTAPPAAAEQKADADADHKEMCACCKKDGGMAAMQDTMKDMMKEMPGKMKDSAKENK